MLYFLGRERYGTPIQVLATLLNKCINVGGYLYLDLELDILRLDIDGNR